MIAVLVRVCALLVRHEPSRALSATSCDRLRYSPRVERLTRRPEQGGYAVHLTRRPAAASGRCARASAGVWPWLKKVGLTSQRAIEMAVREAVAHGRLKGNESLQSAWKVSL